MRRFLLGIWVISFLFGCKQDTANTNWDVDLLAPVITTSLNIGDLLSDSVLTADADGKLRLLIDQPLIDLAFDSILKIPDTTINKDLIVGIPIPDVQPGVAVPSITEITEYELEDKSIRIAKIRSGVLRVDVANLLPTRVRFDYVVPGATKDGTTLAISEWLESPIAGVSQPRILDIDLSGYTFDLQGETGSGSNQIVTTYSLTTDPDGPVIDVPGFNVIFELEYTFADIVLDYGLGYFGQESIASENESTTLEGLESIISGNLFLDSVTVDLELINGIGMDGIFRLDTLRGKNNRTNNTVELSHSIIGDQLLMARAQDLTGYASDVQKIELTYQLNASNSNVKEFIENLPDQLDFAFGVDLNPLGNVSAGNDFFYYDSPFEANIKVDIPLRARVDNLVLQDTIDWDLSQGGAIENINHGELTMIIDNGFPMIGEPTLVLLDSNDQFLDTLLFPAEVAAAPIGPDGRVSNSIESRLVIVLTEEMSGRLSDARRVIIRMRFHSTDQPDLVTFYADYELDIKLVGDFNFTISP